LESLTVDVDEKKGHAEGLLSEKTRGDKTPLELFLAGVHLLPADLISAAKALATIDPASHDT
jgi:hypothetical protein